MKEKILFLGSGSEKDPGFDDVQINGVHYKDFMKEKGIQVVDRVIESCHGCLDRMTEYSREMQYLAENGSRVVAGLQGGLLFGLPSIQATQTTFPIISFPLDMVAYTSFMVPSGHAAIASVGVEKKGEQKQREKGLRLAERILNLDNTIVDIFYDVGNGKLNSELHRFAINTADYNYGKNQLAVAHCDFLKGIRTNHNGFLLWADSDENISDWEYLKKSELRHHQDEYNKIPSAQVRGLANLSIIAAKVLSLKQSYLIERIKDVARKKYDSYGPRKDFIHQFQDAS
jgi:phosphoribosylcarboxyaminoimidazole (NCAIR) mutase